MKKFLLIIILCINPMIGYSQDAVEEEAYYQYNFEQHIITVNTGVRATVELDPAQVYPSIPINLDVFYRYTSANIFGYGAMNITLPFRNLQNAISANWYGGGFIGIGWYAFDKRDRTGEGWSMMMALAGAFYFINENHLGGGARLASRFNYSFQQNFAFNMGFDIDYIAIQYTFPSSNPLLEYKEYIHSMNFSLVFGMTFYINNK